MSPEGSLKFPVKRKVYVRSSDIILWGAIDLGSKCPLVFMRGSLTARRCIAEVLQPVAIKHNESISNAHFEQDNASSIQPIKP